MFIFFLWLLVSSSSIEMESTPQSRDGDPFVIWPHLHSTEQRADPFVIWPHLHSTEQRGDPFVIWPHLHSTEQRGDPFVIWPHLHSTEQRWDPFVILPHLHSTEQRWDWCNVCNLQMISLRSTFQPKALSSKDTWHSGGCRFNPNNQ